MGFVGSWDGKQLASFCKEKNKRTKWANNIIGRDKMRTYLGKMLYYLYKEGSGHIRGKEMFCTFWDMILFFAKGC